MDVRGDPVRAESVPNGATGRRQPALFLPAPLVELVFGVAFLGVAGWLWIGSYAIQGSSKGAMSAAGFPRGIARLLGLSAMLLERDEIRLNRSLNL
jgi:hypothetical protein